MFDSDPPHSDEEEACLSPDKCEDSNCLMDLAHSTSHVSYDGDKQDIFDRVTPKGQQPYVSASTSSPFDDVPDEILWQIFRSVSDWNVIDDRFNQYIKRDIPGLPLTSVSSRWRRVAEGIPQLWSKIDLSYVDLPLDELERPDDRRMRLASLVSLLITRSGTLPLDVKLLNDRVDWDSEFAFGPPHPAAAVLWKSCNRWRSLALVDTETDKVSGPLPYQLNSLERASLNVGEVDLEVHCLSAPRLCTVQLIWEDSWDMPESIMTHRFNQVKHLDLQINLVWRPALDLFPNLEYVVLHLFARFQTSDGSPYILPSSCRFLVLDDIYDPALLTDQLKCFRAPNITGLVLRGLSRFGAHSTDLAVDALTSFVAESGCELTYLAVDDIALSRSQVEKILAKTGSPLIYEERRSSLRSSYGMIIRSQGAEVEDPFAGFDDGQLAHTANSQIEDQ